MTYIYSIVYRPNKEKNKFLIFFIIDPDLTKTTFSTLFDQNGNSMTLSSSTTPQTFSESERMTTTSSVLSSPKNEMNVSGI